MRLTRVILSALTAGLIAASPRVDAAFPPVALKPICLQQIHSPTAIASAPDGSGRLFVCDQVGKIYIVQAGMLLPTPFLNIANPSNPPPDNGPGPTVSVDIDYSERGLLGLAFHPGFTNPLSAGYRKFYASYNKDYAAGNDPGPPQVGDPVNCVTVLTEYQVSASDPNVADPLSERRLLVFTQPQSNHVGGHLEFGSDGLLYIGTGDGGDSEDNNAGHTGGGSSKPTNGLGNAQDKTRYLGKILRIDPVDPDGAGPLTYSIPATNPFFNDATPGVKKEIYALGLCNPWRFSFDKRQPHGTDRLFCGDVGQGRIEEVNLIVAGGNYGWRYNEGTEMPTFSSGAATNPMPHPGGTLIDPIAMYAHPGVVTSPVLPQLGFSVTGGFVYRGSAIPALQGKYIFGDYGSTAGASDGRMMGLEETPPVGSGIFTLTQAIPFVGTTNPIVGQRILCLGEDESGELYVGLKTKAGVLALDNGLPSGGIYKIVPLQSYNVTLAPSKDNTIFSEDVPRAKSTSDALGYLYVGKTGNNYGPYIRRALVAFDVAAQVPPGSVIQSARLRLQPTKLGPSAFGTGMSIYRLSETWGEGTSSNPVDGGYGAPATTGDATWLWRFYNTSSWTTAGGTYNPTASATAVVPAIAQMMTWGPTAQLTADVQGWLDTPSSNAGWILLGNEFTNKTACQFSSIQKGETPPALQINYDSAPSPTHFENWLATYFPTNLVGQFVDLNGDIDRDGIVNGVEYAFAFSPLAANPKSSGFWMTAVEAGGNIMVTIEFRRDPRATDLTYILQTSSDLVTWTTIAQSTAGGDPTGAGFSFETDEPNEAPVKRVVANEVLPASAPRFAVLRIFRAP